MKSLFCLGVFIQTPFLPTEDLAPFTRSVLKKMPFPVLIRVISRRPTPWEITSIDTKESLGKSLMIHLSLRFVHLAT
jgi:hypothetical protein